MSNNRPAIKISKDSPGSDLAAESAAALASAAVLGIHVGNGEYSFKYTVGSIISEPGFTYK